MDRYNNIPILNHNNKYKTNFKNLFINKLLFSHNFIIKLKIIIIEIKKLIL